MSMIFENLMGQIRSMLHEPRPDATEIIRTIQRGVDAQEREVAEHYAFEHFARLAVRENIPAYQPFDGGRMRYDTTTHTLSHPDGTPIKTMCCPLGKRWEQLDASSSTDAARFCAACQRDVYDTQGMSPTHVQKLVQAKPELCLHLDTRHGNVSFVTASPHAHKSDEQLDPEPPHRTSHITEPIADPPPTPKQGGLRGLLGLFLGRTEPSTPPSSTHVSSERLEPWGVRTTFSLIEINAAAFLGYHPIITQFAPHAPGQFIQVWRHKPTGELAVQMDERHVPMPPPYREWEIALPGFTCRPSMSHAAFAVYLLPREVKRHDRLYLEEALVPHRGDRPWDTPSLECRYGTWTGTKVELDRPEPPVSREWTVVG